MEQNNSTNIHDKEATLDKTYTETNEIVLEPFGQDVYTKKT